MVFVALWSEDRELAFKVTNNLQSSSLFDLKTPARHHPGIHVTNEFPVRAWRLDTRVAERAGDFLFQAFDFVTIDTQGAELAILRGMGALIDRP